MKKITLFSILAVLFAAMSFTSCNSSSDNGFQLPTKQEAYNMMLTVGGSHQCGILFPADKNNNIQEKDSIVTSISINPSDSTYRISNFPVKLLAKYVKNEKYSKLISEVPNQTLSGKLHSLDATTPFFYTQTYNITFKDEQNNNYLWHSMLSMDMLLQDLTRANRISCSISHQALSIMAQKW